MSRDRAPPLGIREPTLADLAAREALRDLVVAYSRAIDRRDMALLRSLYHDDAREEHGAMFSGGPDAYVAFVSEALKRYEATVHYVAHAAFVVAGDMAEGEIHKINYHRAAGPDAHETVTGSRSFDRYRRDAHGWRFLSRSVALDWARRTPVDPAAYRDFAAASPPGRPGPDDPSYRFLSLFPRHDGAGS